MNDSVYPSLSSLSMIRGRTPTASLAQPNGCVSSFPSLRFGRQLARRNSTSLIPSTAENSDTKKSVRLHRWLDRIEPLLTKINLTIYGGLLIVFLVSFWLAYLTTTFSKPQQYSDLSSDLILVFGVLLAFSPLVRGREKRFITATLSMGGLLFSLETKLVAETSQDMARLSNLFYVDAVLLLIVAAILPLEMLRMKDEETSQDTREAG